MPSSRMVTYWAGASGAGLEGFWGPQAVASQSRISRASCICNLPVHGTHEGYSIRKLLPFGYAHWVLPLPFGGQSVVAARTFLIKKRACNATFGT